MYRLGLIVCLVLSDVNVFLKLKRKRGFSDSFDGLISYFVYFALKAEEHAMFYEYTYFCFVFFFFFFLLFFSLFLFCIYCAGMKKKCDVNFRCKYMVFFSLTNYCDVEFIINA